MTDTFASGTGPSFGDPPASPHSGEPSTPSLTGEGGSTDEVTSTLAELEQKLRELERELSSMDSEQTPSADQIPAFEADTPAPADVAQSFTTTLEDEPEAPEEEPSEPFIHSTPRLVDESLLEEPAQPQSPPQAQASEELPSESSESAVEYSYSDHQDYQDAPEPAVESVASPAIAELLGFRDRLERFTRELTDEYNELLSALTSEASRAPQAPAPAFSENHQPVPSSLPSAPPESLQSEPFTAPEPVFESFGEPVVPEPAFESSGEAAMEKPSFESFGEPAVDEPPAISYTPEVGHQAPLHHPDDPSFEARESAFGAPLEVQPPAPVVPPSPPLASAESSEEDQMLLSGHVELAAGPFYDIASLSSFESDLAGLTHVGETSVRRFEASHAVIDVHLTSATALVGQLRSVVESPFSVRQVASNRLALTFDES